MRNSIFSKLWNDLLSDKISMSQIKPQDYFSGNFTPSSKLKKLQLSLLGMMNTNNVMDGYKYLTGKENFICIHIHQERVKNCPKLQTPNCANFVTLG